ncbi:hypothetical protein [Dokdonia sp.]
MTIGQNKGGLMNITDVYSRGLKAIKYSVISQTAWTVTLLFENV